MSLALICGADQTVNELLSAAIKDLTGVNNYAWAIVKKIKAAEPAECGKQMTLAEKIKSTVALVTCPLGDVIAINVVETACDCLNCGDEIPCNMTTLTFEQKVLKTIVYTTAGEWAWNLIDITT